MPRAKYCKRALKSFNLAASSGNVRYSGHCLPRAWRANSRHSTCENKIDGPSVMSTSSGGAGMYSSRTLKIASIFSFGLSRVPQWEQSSAKTFSSRSCVCGWSSAAPIKCHVDSGKNLSQVNLTNGVASIWDEKYGIASPVHCKKQKTMSSSLAVSDSSSASSSAWSMHSLTNSWCPVMVFPNLVWLRICKHVWNSSADTSWNCTIVSTYSWLMMWNSMQILPGEVSSLL